MFHVLLKYDIEVNLCSIPSQLYPFLFNFLMEWYRLVKTTIPFLMSPYDGRDNLVELPFNLIEPMPDFIDAFVIQRAIN